VHSAITGPDGGQRESKVRGRAIAGYQPDCITQAGLHIPDVVVILIRSTGHHVRVIGLHPLDSFPPGCQHPGYPARLG
jgi:hypothetical protein